MKTILITGASGDIGKEIAKTLAKNNNLVLLGNKNIKGLNEFVKQLSTKHDIIVQKCDLSDFETAENILSNVTKTLNIDVLINCAGTSLFQQIQDTTENDYNKIFDNNLKSTIIATKVISKNMISNKKGKIINISSIWGCVGSSMESLYSASKGAINTLTLALAKELGPSNITVNAVCPGLIDTKMNSNLSTQTKNDIVESTPLSRIGTPKDVANLVEFLASDKSNFITGQIITIDGGWTL